MICHKEIEKELKASTGIRLCCESSRGGIITELGSVDPEKSIDTISSLCNSNPDNHPKTPFDTFVSESFSPDINLPNPKKLKYLYGMPNCPTHDYNLTDYQWSILMNGNLRIGNKVYNQTNYCINFGREVKEGNVLPDRILFTVYPR